MAKERSYRYTAVAIALHWVMAILLVFMIWLGWNMDDHEGRIQLHKSIGITLLILTVARIVWRWLNPPPPLPDMPSLEKRASHLVHMGFYGLTLALPLAGWVLVSSSKFHVPTVLFGTISWPHLPFMGPFKTELGHTLVETLHSKGAWLLIALLALHVAGAVKHEVTGDEGVLRRMLPGIFGQTSGSFGQSRGVLVAFGCAFGLFAAIASIPLLSSVTSGSTLVPVSGKMGNWTVDYTTSDIGFSGIHDGEAFSGQIEIWSADISFDPDRLDQARAVITLSSGSMSTGKKLYDDSLIAAEWFDPITYPVISVVVDGIVKADNGYTSSAHITLKDYEVTVPFDFDLSIIGEQATMTGTSTLSRAALNLGQVSDPDADWVSDEIVVTVSLNAQRD
ncbi:MAG: cytochrome b/b6 domain-containing protein [Hyphomonas sp.]